LLTGSLERCARLVPNGYTARPHLSDQIEEKSRGEPYLHTMNATLVLSVVLTYLASDVNSTPGNSGDGRIRYRCEFGYRLFDSHGEIATQVESACPFAWPREQNSCRTH
jgi:hypothetical protein